MKIRLKVHRRNRKCIGIYTGKGGEDNGEKGKEEWEKKRI